jgi:hypothetical protein
MLQMNMVTIGQKENGQKDKVGNMVKDSVRIAAMERGFCQMRVYYTM